MVVAAVVVAVAHAGAGGDWQTAGASAISPGRVLIGLGTPDRRFGSKLRVRHKTPGRGLAKPLSRAD